jgi:hypothetical protein
MVIVAQIKLLPPDVFRCLIGAYGDECLHLVLLMKFSLPDLKIRLGYPILVSESARANSIHGHDTV